MAHEDHKHVEKMKVVVFAPSSHADQVREALGNANAGHIGNYSHCSFTTKGIGRFKPEEGADPAEGQIGELSEVEEEKIETICMKDQVEDIVAAVEEAHPYEEPAVDVYPIIEIDKK